jgi:hypothetical protein
MLAISRYAVACPQLNTDTNRRIVTGGICREAAADSRRQPTIIGGYFFGGCITGCAPHKWQRMAMFK